MRTVVFTRSMLVTMSRRAVIGILLAGFGLITCIPSTADAGSKKYYQTQDTFDGSHALTASDNGFHMASLWEIFNTSILKYDTKRGLTFEDTGSGPPITDAWIRTGNEPVEIDSEGLSNCNAWQSNDAGHFGTRADLTDNWAGGAVASRISPWSASTDTCNLANNVWCVQD